MAQANIYHNLPTQDQLKKVMKVDNPHQLPAITKVVVNVGVGELEKDQREAIAKEMANIIGQKLAITKAKKSVAGFKIRAGQIVGLRATLRGQKMWLFLNKLVNVALPRTRDFRGIKRTGITSGGILNIGIRDLGIFPEIKPEANRGNTGFQMSIVTTAKTKEQTEEYLTLLGFPLEK